MYLEFKRHSGISLSTGDLALTTPGAGAAPGVILLPEGVSTSSLDSARSRSKKPTIDRTIKPMSASVGGISRVLKGKGELHRGLVSVNSLSLEMLSRKDADAVLTIYSINELEGIPLDPFRNPNLYATNDTISPLSSPIISFLH